MNVTRVYATPDGETHFAELDIPLHPSGTIGMLSEKFPATGVIFRTTPASYDFRWHCAPRRQFVVMLNGHVRVAVSDGETREFRGGDVFLLEDVAPCKGHCTTELSGIERRTLFIPLDPQ
jgi:uncharacterized cupin superfamily protein